MDISLQFEERQCRQKCDMENPTLQKKSGMSEAIREEGIEPPTQAL